MSHFTNTNRPPSIVPEVEPNDWHYTALAELNDWPFRAARDAVLTPIIGTKWKKDFESQKRGLLQLRHRWWEFLQRMRAAGWSRLGPDSGYRAFRNCPPFGVTTKQFNLFCGQPHLCPFCFGRDYVARPYKMLHQPLWPDGEAGDAPAGKRKPYRIVGHRISATSSPFLTGDDLEAPGRREEIIRALHEFRCHEFTLSRDQLIRKYRADYGVVLWTAEPCADRMRYCRSTIFLTALAVPKPYTDEGAQLEWRDTVTQRELARICAKFLAYPRAMLKTAPRDVVAIVEGLWHFHRISFHGKLLKPPRVAAAVSVPEDVPAVTVDPHRFCPNCGFNLTRGAAAAEDDNEDLDAPGENRTFLDADD